MTKEEVGNLVGSFTWLWSQQFFIETERGNFIWSDPDYGGDNTVRSVASDFKTYLFETGIEYGRDKGHHKISNYIGEDFDYLGE
jgi:hypothetical protein